MTQKFSDELSKISTNALEQRKKHDNRISEIKKHCLNIAKSGGKSYDYYPETGQKDIELENIFVELGLTYEFLSNSICPCGSPTNWGCRCNDYDLDNSMSYTYFYRLRWQ